MRFFTNGKIQPFAEHFANFIRAACLGASRLSLKNNKNIGFEWKALPQISNARPDRELFLPYLQKKKSAKINTYYFR
jgi:hypothetical protein